MRISPIEILTDEFERSLNYADCLGFTFGEPRLTVRCYKRLNQKELKLYYSGKQNHFRTSRVWQIFSADQELFEFIFHKAVEKDSLEGFRSGLKAYLEKDIPWNRSPKIRREILDAIGRLSKEDQLLLEIV